MPAGRPTEYKEDYSQHAYNYCLMGATNEKLAEFFKVSVATINNWKNVHPEFLDAIKKGRDIYDTETVEKSLLDRANGYTHKEQKVFCNNGKIVTKEVDKHYPPDPTSMIFWLKNRNPKRWRDKIEIAGRFAVSNFDLELTDDEQAAYQERMKSVFGDDIPDLMGADIGEQSD